MEINNWYYNIGHYTTMHLHILTSDRSDAVDLFSRERSENSASFNLNHRFILLSVYQ